MSLRRSGIYPVLLLLQTTFAALNALGGMGSLRAAEPAHAASPPQYLLTRWRQRTAEAPTAEVNWIIERDSRAADFGEQRAGAPFVWQLRILGERYRLDGERLTVIGRDGRPRPAESDADRARLEFRQALQEKLAGEQRIPFFEPAVFSKSVDRFGDTSDLGPLEWLVVEGAMRLLRPTAGMNPAQFRESGRFVETGGQRQWVYEERLSAQDRREFWIDEAHGGRLRRVIETRGNRTLQQIDWRYSDDGQDPESWTVQRFDPRGAIVEFAVVRVTRWAPGAPLADDLLEGAQPQIAAPAAPRRWRWLGRLRHLADVLWFPAGLVFAGTLVRHARRQQAGGAARRSVVRAAWLPFVLLMGAVTLRNVPLFEPSLGEGQRVASDLLSAAQRLLDESASEAAWREFSAPALEQLQALTGEFEAARERRRQLHLWSRFAPPDRAAEAAAGELVATARQDIAAVIRAGPRKDPLRERIAVERLERVGDHVAGISPYIPPLKRQTPYRTPEQLAADAEQRRLLWTLLALNGGALLVGTAVAFGRRPRRSRQGQPAPAE